MCYFLSLSIIRNISYEAKIIGHVRTHVQETRERERTEVCKGEGWRHSIVNVLLCPSVDWGCELTR